MTILPNNKPLVSVIVTTYNAAGSIKRLLDSVYAQQGLGTVFDLEVIVADDCSSDHTVEIIGQQFPQVRLLVNSQNSGGPNKGRNRALNEAKGQWIAIADDDDEWLPSRIMRQLQAAAKAPIVSSGYRYEDLSHGRSTDRVSSFQHTGNDGFAYFEKNKTFKQLLSRDNKRQSCYIGSLFFSASLKDRLFEETYGWLDVDWIIRLFEDNDSVEVCQPLYIRWFYGEANLSMNPRYRADDYQGAIDCLQRYAAQYPVETAIGIKRANGSYARYHYLKGDMKHARHYFCKAGFSLKNLVYWLTTFVGSNWVKKHFNVFG